MTILGRRFLLLIAGILAVGGAARSASACQIPVFRFALERWQPEPLEIIVFHRGPLTAAQQATIEILGGDRKTPANTSVTAIDVAGKLSGQAAKLWAAQPETVKARLPWAIVRPAEGEDKHGPVWAGPLSDDTAKAIVDSAARRLIVQKLLKGESAVWVLVETGDKKRDDEANTLLTAELERLQKTLKVPDIDPSIPGPRLLSAVPLKLSFSILRISRQDAGERVLVSMLTRGLPPADPKDATRFDPVVVPIFGQGRGLIQVSGKEITRESIEQISRFLVGECSCQVKELNPGFDLLMSADWTSILDENAVAAEPKKAAIPDPVIGSGKPK